MVALDLDNGHTVWTSETFRSSHASPVLIRIDDQPFVCLHGMFELIAIDPSNGKVPWRHLLRKSASDNVSFTPLWDPARKQILVSHGYDDKGTQAIGVSFDGTVWSTELRWVNRDMRIVHTNAVIVEDQIVGTNHDPSNIFVGIGCDDGKTNFRKRIPGKANFVRVGDLLFCLSATGNLIEGEIQNDEFEEILSIEVADGKSWTVPSITGKFLLCRVGQQLVTYKFKRAE